MLGHSSQTPLPHPPTIHSPTYNRTALIINSGSTVIGGRGEVVVEVVGEGLVGCRFLSITTPPLSHLPHHHHSTFRSLSLSTAPFLYHPHNLFPAIFFALIIIWKVLGFLMVIYYSFYNSSVFNYEVIKKRHGRSVSREG